MDNATSFLGSYSTGWGLSAYIPTNVKSVASASMTGLSTYLNKGLQSIGSLPYIGALTGPSGNDSSVELRDDTVVWSGFQECNWDIGSNHSNNSSIDIIENGCSRMYLCVAYGSGFQVWNVSSPSVMHQVASIKDGYAVRYVRAIPPPLLPERSRDRVFAATSSPTVRTSQLGSLIAVLSAKDCPGFSTSIVKLFSRVTGKYVHELRFLPGSEIYSVLANRRVLLVALKDSIHGFELSSLERLFELPCFPNSIGTEGAMALGARWIAYPSRDRMSHVRDRAPQNVSGGVVKSDDSKLTQSDSASRNQFGFVQGSSEGLSTSLVDTAYGYAGRLSQTLHDYGEQGRRRVSAYLHPGSVVRPASISPPNNSALSISPPRSAASSMPFMSQNEKYPNDRPDVMSQDSADSEAAGVVVVRDIASRNVLAVMRPHTQPISNLTFDSTGTLLVTASLDGHNFNVFRLHPPTIVSANSRSSNLKTVSHIYKLHRGYSNAVIRGLSFSADSRWICATTARGTVHIFALNGAEGGIVDPWNHASGYGQLPSRISPLVDSNNTGDKSSHLAMVDSVETTSRSPPDSSNRLVGGNFRETPTVLSIVDRIKHGSSVAGECLQVSISENNEAEDSFDMDAPVVVDTIPPVFILPTTAAAFISIDSVSNSALDSFSQDSQTFGTPSLSYSPQIDTNIRGMIHGLYVMTDSGVLFEHMFVPTVIVDEETRKGDLALKTDARQYWTLRQPFVDLPLLDNSSEQPSCENDEKDRLVSLDENINSGNLNDGIVDDSSHVVKNSSWSSNIEIFTHRTEASSLQRRGSVTDESGKGYEWQSNVPSGVSLWSRSNYKLCDVAVQEAIPTETESSTVPSGSCGAKAKAGTLVSKK